MSTVSPVSPPEGTRGRGTQVPDELTVSRSNGHGSWTDDDLQALIDKDEERP